MAPLPPKPTSLVWPAGKLRHPQVPSELRVILPEDAGQGPLVLHKDAFSWGGQAQLFAGIFAGRPVVVRRLNALPPHTPGGLREILAGSRNGRQDTQDPGQIEKDVRVTQTVARGRGREFVALSTRREPGGGVGKVFQLLEPMQADLLGVVHALSDQPMSVRVAVAGFCIERIATDMAVWHASGIAHCDLRAENLLLRTHPNGDIWVEGHDFGLAAADTRDGEILADASRQDVRDLGRVALMLLQPALRPYVAGARLPSSLSEVCRLVPSWAPLLRKMVGADRVTMAEVAKSLTLPDGEALRRQRVAFAVLHEVRHKAEDIAECLDEITPWLTSLLPPPSGESAGTPEAAHASGPAQVAQARVLDPAAWAAIAARLRALAAAGPEPPTTASGGSDGSTGGGASPGILPPLVKGG